VAQPTLWMVVLREEPVSEATTVSLIEGVRPFFEVTDELDLILAEANRIHPRARARPMTGCAAALRPGFVTRHLRATELPGGPGWAVLASSRAFDGTPIYVQPEDIRYGLVFRDKGGR